MNDVHNIHVVGDSRLNIVEPSPTKTTLTDVRLYMGQGGDDGWGRTRTGDTLGESGPRLVTFCYVRQNRTFSSDVSAKVTGVIFRLVGASDP